MRPLLRRAWGWLNGQEAWQRPPSPPPAPLPKPESKELVEARWALEAALNAVPREQAEVNRLRRKVETLRSGVLVRGVIR